MYRYHRAIENKLSTKIPVANRINTVIGYTCKTKLICG